ncbi:MAG: PAS domain-containing protein [Pseudomonadota bacterium]|nr:PAS domain-containing protein [Pseudomonadota bacterium]
MEFVAGNWPECLQRLGEARIDLQVAIAWSKEREKSFSFSDEPLFINWGALYVQPDSKIESIVDLAERKVAVLKGDIHYRVFSDLLTQFKTRPQLFEVDSYGDVFKKIEDGDVDAGLVNRLYGGLNDRRYKVERTSMILNPIEVRYAAPLGSTKMLATINQHFRRMKKNRNSVYHQSMNRWMGGSGVGQWRLPAWILWLLPIAGLFILALLLVNVLLNKKVVKRTAQLRQVNDDLIESRERLAFAVDGTGLGLWEWNVETNELILNDNWLTMLGYEPTEFAYTYENWVKLVHPQDLPAVLGLIEAHLKGESPIYEAEFRMKSKDGTWRWILARGRLLQHAEDGLAKRFIGTHLDNTERKAVEEERLQFEAKMQHTQKLESLGVLAGGIAHDFNNILTAILGNADLALMEISSVSPAVPRIEAINNAALRAAGLAQQMLAYSGRGKFVSEEIKINELVEEMGHLLAVALSKKVVLRYHLANSLPLIDADAAQIRQVVMNLITNAAEAIGERSGVVTVTTGLIDCSEPYLGEAFAYDDLEAGMYVFVEIADTGCGMDEETKNKLFDPFFTTKFTGRGLGMAAVLGIIRGHKGAIKVYSEEGKGSTFKVLIPALERPAIEINHHLKEVDNGWLGSGTILLVDDEETIRALGKEMLKLLGFAVLTAADGRQALGVFKANKSDIVAVVLDLTMPHMDGVETYRELRQIDKDVRVIVASGYSESDISEQFAGKGLAGVIQKPFQLAAFREKLKTALTL